MKGNDEEGGLFCVPDGGTSRGWGFVVGEGRGGVHEGRQAKKEAWREWQDRIARWGKGGRWLERRRGKNASVAPLDS